MKGDPYITHIIPERGRPFYWVRFLKGSDKKQKHVAQKPFVYTPGIDKIRALKDARDWRDAKRIELGKSLDGSAKSRPSTRKNKVRKDCHNTTGFVGVCEHERELLNGTYHYFQVNWMQTIDGVRVACKKGMRYRPDEEGDREHVFMAAKRLRRKMVKLHYIK